MSQKEFVSVVFDSRILNFGEISELMKYYSYIELTSPLPFIHTPRASSIKLHQLICYRFSVYQSPGVGGCWSYSDKNPDVIVLSVNKSVKLHGIQHFGSEGCHYTVSIEVNNPKNGFSLSLVKKTGSYTSEKDETHGYFGFTVWFDPPLHLHMGERYEVTSLIQGPSSWYGEQGKPSLECSQVQFNFYHSTSSRNGTNNLRGQFSAFLFNK